MIHRSWIFFVGLIALIGARLLDAGFVSKLFQRRLKSNRLNAVKLPSIESLKSTQLAVVNISSGELQNVLSGILQSDTQEISPLGSLSVNGTITIVPQKPIWKRKCIYTFKASVRHRPSLRSDFSASGSITLTGKQLSGSFFKAKTLIVIAVDYVLSSTSLSLSYRIDNEDSFKDSTAILAIWKSFLDKALRAELGLLTARKRLISSYQTSAESRVLERKKRQLDEIIHPEKYRKTRTRSSGSADGRGSGRFTPSAATQARRQVRGK